MEHANAVPETTGTEFQRILVASDLTAHTDRAFDRAVMLARQNRASIHFIHAMDRGLLPASYVKRSLREAQARFEDELEDSRIGRALDTTFKVAVGDAEQVILEEAEAMRPDVIIMGLSRDASLAGLIRGTTIDKVVRRARCPILVVKRRARHPYEKVAVAVDLAEPSRRALDFVLQVFPAAELAVMHVDEAVATGAGTPKEEPAVRVERRHQIEDMVAARVMAARRGGHRLPKEPKLIFGGGRPLDFLQKHVAQLKPDLLAMGTHGRTGVSSLFLGSVAETLLGVVQNDVLVIRA